MELKIGMVATESVVVEKHNTAAAVGSGSLEVFATPMMIALIEKAACSCIGACLSEEESSVGTEISVTHDAPTPLGMTVTATAELVAMDRRSLTFKVKAEDESGLIGQGTHQRFIINKERFMARAQEKKV